MRTGESDGLNLEGAQKAQRIRLAQPTSSSPGSFCIASIVLPTFGAPDWVMPIFTALLVLLFPLVLVFAWAYELTPEGLKRTQDVPREQPIRHIADRHLN